MKREGAEIVASMLTYKNLNVFKQTDIVRNGFTWWHVAKKNTRLLYKVKVMIKMLVTNNEKCGYICNCNVMPDVSHILFDCTHNNLLRDELYKKMTDEMPVALKMAFQDMNCESKITLLFNCYGDYVTEWTTLYKATVNFIYGLCKFWYESLG